jgi:hypothetical protein
MAEGNGSGRLDRIEAILEGLAERQREFAAIQERDHEEFKRDHKQLMTWQVLMQDKMDRFAEDRKSLDLRVDKLVLSISELVSKIPPAALKS